MTTKTQQSAKKTVRAGVPTSEVLPLLEELTPDTGFVHGAQRAFYQVKGPGGHRLYVGPCTPEGIGPVVRRVDLAMELPEELCNSLLSLAPPRAPNGSVRHELDTSAPSFLDDLRLVLLHMADPSTPPVQPRKRTAFVPTLPSTAQLLPRASDRRRLIEEVARQKGVSISVEAEAELRAAELAEGASSPDAAPANAADWDAVASMVD